MKSKLEDPQNAHNRRTFLAMATLAAGGIACGNLWPQSPLLKIFHAPQRFTRRAGDFFANICGSLTGMRRSGRYRLNQGPWHKLQQAPPRVPAPFFTIELSAEELQAATNQLQIETTGFGYKSGMTALQFDYDPSPIVLPINVDWSSNELDVQDGHWELCKINGARGVRPVPGFEDYDRVIVVCGAFSGGRRVETDFIFRYNVFKNHPFGFGVLPLWGGHPEVPGIRPRRGWNFGLAWYYSRYLGVGLEFSYKYSNATPQWVASYRDLKLVPGRRYFIIVECWPESDAAGNHRCYRQRMKWWAEGTTTPDSWIELADASGAPLPAREYAVALVAHRSQVEFGPVRITPVESQVRLRT